MHVPQKLRKELKRKGTKALAFFLAFVLAVQCMNLPVIVAAATDAAGNALATVEDTPSNDQATSAATDQAADQAATETEQPATEQAPVEQPATEQAPVEQPAEPAEPAEPATEEPAATEAPAADQPAESATPAGSENVTAGGASENGQAPVAPAADTTATVALSLAQSTLTVGADTYTATDKTMEAPANQELKFSVAPEGGFAVKTVKQIAADRTETELSADASGIYTIAPEAVADGLEIKVETEEAPAAEEQPAEEAPAEEPATDESTDETTEPTEDEAATEEPAEDEAATDEQTPADEATEDEAVEEAASEDKAAVVDELVTEDGQAVTELESDSVKADVSSPAFEGYAHVGDITVKVTAGEGIVPEGTTVSAYRVNRQDVLDAVSSVVEKNGKVVEDSVAIDVTLLGPDGNVIQPDGAVNVCFFNSNVGDSTVNVYRVADDASTVQAVGTRQADASVQSFDVDHFSIYVVTDEGEPALATYNFYVNDGIVSTQVVKTGDTLYKPAAPDANDNGFKFTGWYTKEQGGELFDGFGEQNVSETKTVDLYAHFEEVHYVFFYDKQGRIFHTEEGVTGDKIDASAVTVPGLALSEGLTGWYNNDQLEGDAVETVTVGDDNIYLYPKIESGHWITFDSDGGTYIEPEFVAAGQNTKKPNDPTRTGYTFDGWKTESEEAFSFGEHLSADVTLTASWRAGQADYTVIYWVENANDENYSFLTSSVRTGIAGNQTPGQQQLALTQQSWNQIDRNVREAIGLEFGDIHLSSDNPFVPAEINGDGSTIVNVYYDRDVDTIKFYRYQRNGIFGGSWDEITDYRIQAKVGEFIGDQWPKNSGYLWGVTFSLGEYQAYAEVMPSGGHSFYGTTASGSETATYYVEALPGQSGTEWHDGKWYVVHHQDTTPGSGYTISDSDCYALTGYSFEEYEGTGWSGNSYDNSSFYYSRNDYQLVFINQGSTEDTVSVPYETKLSSYSSRMPASMGPEGTEFAGWYDNPLGEGQPYNFSTTMPAHAVTLYAKWAPKTYTATVYADQDGSEVAKELKIEFGTKLSEDDLDEPKTIDGKIFVGWATRVGSEGDYTYVLYNFDTEVRDNLKLYPYYISTGSYTVTYDANGGTGTAPTDERKYAEDSHADVLHPEGLTAPEGKVFLGWNTQSDGTGKMYQPEDKILVEKNVTLYAQWGDQANTTSITYIANYPTDSGLEQPSAYVVDDVANNAEHKVLSVEGAGFQVPEGFEFVGWLNAGDTYQAGATVHVDELGGSDANILTAQWNRVYYVGTPIQIEVFQDDEQVAADDYVTADNLDGGTDNFKAEYGKVDPLEYTVTYTYKELNCADIKLTVTIPDGYAALVSSNSSLTTGSATYTCDRNGNVWALDNVSGGSTITVKLVKLEADVSIEGWIYNGQFDPQGTLSSEAESEADGATVSYKYYGKDAETGEYTVELAGEPVDAGDYRVVATWTETDNYPSLSDYCDFTVAPATLTVTTKSDSKAYDGAALTAPSTAEEAVSGLQNGEAVAFKVTGSQTEVGWSDNTYEIDWDAEETTAKKSNYTVTENLGTLTVTKGDAADYDADVTISGWTYNGQFDPQGTLSSEAESEADGATVSYKYYGKDAETGEYTVELAGEPVDAGDYRVVATWTETDNYPSLSDYCDFTVAPATLTVTTKSDSKAYDGAALTAPSTAEEAVSGLQNGEAVAFKVTGSQTEVGWSDNTYEIDWDAEETTAKKSNYTVTENLGTLTVTKGDAADYDADVTISGWTYNGQFDPQGTLSSEAESEADGATVSYKYYGKDAETGEYTVELAGEPVDAGDYRVVATWTETDNYPSLSDYCDFTVAPATLTVTTKSDSKAYDGAALTAPSTAEEAVSGLQNGEAVAFKVTGSQTEVGWSDNTYEIDWDAEETTAKKSNYTVTENLGTLTVTKGDAADYDADVTISGWTYNGQFDPQGTLSSEAESEADGATVSYKYYGKDAETGEYTVELAGEPVDAGDYRVVATWTETDNYPSLSDYCDFTVAPATLTVTTKSDSKAYDGAALTAPSTAEEAVSGLQNGEAVAFKVTGSQTEVGWSDNTYEIDWDAEETTAKKSNYTVTENLGTLTVTKGDAADYDADVTISGWTYNGQFDPQGTLSSEAESEADGATVSYKYYGKDAETGEYTVELAGEPVDAGDYRVVATWTETDNYPSLSDYCDFTVAPATLTVTTKSDSKAYDGAALTAPSTAEEAVSGLQNGEAVAFKVTGSQTEVGWSDNTYEIDWDAEETTAKKSNYTVTENLGTLTVTKGDAADYDADVTISGWTYNGQFDPQGTLSSEAESEADGATVSYKYYGKDAETGEYTVELAGEPVDAGDYRVVATWTETDNYPSLSDYCDFTVAPATLTVTTKSDSKAYDGAALTAPSTAEEAVSGLQNGEAVAFKVTGSQTEVGWSDNTYEIDWDAEETTAKKSNYTVTENLGTLTVTKGDAADYDADVTISGWTYNGQFDPQGTLSSEAESEADGATVSYKYYGKDAETGEYTVELAGEPVDAGDYRVVATWTETDNYPSLSDYCDFTVAPATLTVTTKSDSKAYDGAALTAPSTAEEAVSGLQNGEAVAFKVTGSQTEVGWSDNTYEIDWDAEETTAKKSNYTVTENLGTLTVTKGDAADYDADVTISGWTYNGQFDPQGTLSSEAESEADGATVSYKYYGKDAETGEYTVELAGEPVDAGDYRVVATWTETDNYPSLSDYCDFTVAPATLTVTTKSDSKAYDGAALTAPSTAEEAVSGLQNGEAVAFKVTGSQTEVGWSDNTYEIDWDAEETTAKKSNYTVTENLGTLTVTKGDAADYDADVTISGWTYNGQFDPQGTLSSEAESEADGATVSYKYYGKDAETGEYTVELAGEPVDAGDYRVVATWTETDNYPSLSDYCDFTVAPATLTVTTKSDSKAYDGAALTAPSTAEEAVSGLQNGEAVAFKVTGSQTEVGWSDNTYEIDWDAEETTAKKSNYTVTENLGTLTVTKGDAADYDADVTISGWTYNGQFDPQGTLSSEAESEADGATVSYKYYGKDAETGEYTVELAGEPVDAGDYRVVATWTETDNYPSLSDYCDFTVAPATLTVTTKSDSKAYDGAALTAPSTAEEAVSGLQNGEAVAFKVTGSQTEVGWSDNTYEIDWDAEETTAKKSNYTVTENLGTLTVTKGDAADYDADVTISGWTYNGQFDPQGTLSSEAESEADGATVSYKYYGKDAETGEYTVELAGEPVDAGDYRVVATWTETDNYPSLSDYCDFTVAPATLTVTTKSDSKAYDGAALTAPSTAEEAVSGLQNGEAVAFKVTGSQTEVGWSDNTYEIDWDAEETTAKKSNYTVTENLGTLTVTKGDAADYDADVTISGWTYNGQFDPQGTLSSEAESEADGATVSYKYYGKDAETGEYTVELAGEPVDAGDYRVVATWTETDNYPSLSDYCDFTIEKRPVELTGSGWATDQPYTGKAYGKTDFETEAFDAEADRGLVEGQKLSGVSYEISGTEVGPYEGKFSGTPVVKAEGSDDDLAANYSFSYEVGKLNIVESAIAQYVTLDPADVSEVYDGQAHAAGTAKATDKNGKTAKVEYSVDGEKWTENPAEITATNVSDSVTVKVRASVPGTYTGYVEGTQELEITARPVTITVADDSKVFGQDDPVFEDAVMTNHVKGELADIDLSVIRSNEEEGVDHYEDVLTIGQTAEELNGLYGNYTFTVEPGDFEITQQTINPEDPDDPDSYLNVQVSQPADVTYNGKHQQSPVKVERLDADGNVIATLEEGVDYKLTYVDDVNAGAAKVTVEGKGNYKGKVTKEYTINPAKAMIVVNNNAKVYGEKDPAFQGKVVLYNDGACDQPLYLNVLTRKQDVLGDIAYSRTNAEVESAGTYEGVLTAAVKDGTLNGNYTYDVWPGDFHIAKSTDLVAKITSTAEDMTKVYDGKALTLTAEATPAEGSTLMYSTDGGTTWTDEAPSITNVGTLDVQVKAVNPNYEDSYPVEATLTVTPATLTITTPSAAKVFDGTPLEAPGSAEECVTGLKNGETVDFKTTGTITAVGQTDNTYAIVFAGEEGATEATAQSGNYRIVTEDLGTLQVFPQSVDPDDPDPSNPDPDDPDPSKPDPENPDQPFYTGITVEWPGNTEYNGKSQELPVTVKDRNGNVLTQSTDGGKTGDYVLVYGDDTVNAGEVKVTVKGVNNYGGEISGSYQITPVTLTISTPDASKLYDGTALTTGEDSATVKGLMDDDQVQTTVYGSQTEADVSANHVRIDGWVNTEPTNYDVKLNLGTLLVYPQSINPEDPDPSNPDPTDPDPTVPDPENPDQPFYSGATVDSPSDLIYDGADHTWEPTVLDAQGNKLVLNEDYAVTYSKADRTNVTGAIEVTITGMGDYAGTVTRTYQITPREIVLTIDNQTKVAGTADPTFTSSYEGTVPGEVAGWSFQTGHVRDAGEAVGSYAINQGDMQLADNPSTGFLASNYTLRVIPGTLTITPAPATPGDGGTGTNPGTNPGGGTGTNPGAGTTAAPTPATATDGTAAAVTDDTAEAIEDEATPLAAGTERISDDETPLASGREDRDCWVHWLMLVGLVISAVYYLGAVIHRRKFTADLEGYEKDVLDPDNRNA